MNILLIKSNVPLVMIQMLYSRGERERERLSRRELGRMGE